MRAPQASGERTISLVTGLAALVAVKLGFVVAYGPTFLPDSRDYVDIADVILAGRLNDPALVGGIFPPALFRIVGYPAVISLSKAARGDLWPSVPAALQ